MTSGVRALYLASDICSDVTIAVSTAVRDRLVRWGVSARKIEIIPNGLDLHRVAADPVAGAEVRDQLELPSSATVIGSRTRYRNLSTSMLFATDTARMSNCPQTSHRNGDGTATASTTWRRTKRATADRRR